MKVKDLWKPARLVPKLYELPGKKKKSKKGKKKGKKAKTRKPIKGNVLISVDPKDEGSLDRIVCIYSLLIGSRSVTHR